MSSIHYYLIKRESTAPTHNHEQKIKKKQQGCKLDIHAYTIREK